MAIACPAESAAGCWFATELAARPAAKEDVGRQAWTCRWTGQRVREGIRQ
jgi:hypothetical protein